MKKIMFNDHYGLTGAVLSGRKTMTRRIITPQPHISDRGGVVWKGSAYGINGHGVLGSYRNFINDTEYDKSCRRYRVGEVVAIAQSYKDAGVNFLPEEDDEFGCHNFPAEQTNGWTNKMFVRADLMPYHIRITKVRMERLQEISDEDCVKELALRYESRSLGFKKYQTEWVYQFLWDDKLGRTMEYSHTNPKEVFAVMIDKICGIGTWESNPFVFVYEFELIENELPTIL